MKNKSFRKVKFILMILLIALIGLSSQILVTESLSEANENKIVTITLDKIINPITSSYFKRALDTAEKEGAELVILLIDTPGGLMESMKDITQAIINSPIIVVGFTFPTGARAASAGAFIMMACDITAMAPATRIGAAHPVAMGQKLDKTMSEKIVNDSVAFIESLARQRNRNLEKVRKMVKNSISLDDNDALKFSVIEYKADTIEELLRKLNRKSIKKKRRLIKLQTIPNKIIKKEISLIEKFLYHIAHPNIAYILLMLGIYGIISEFSTPGVGFPGMFGAIALLLAFFALSNLPINLTGLLLIALSGILFILEIKLQSHGVLGIGAAVSLLLGSLMLIRSPNPQYKISLGLILGVGIFTIIFFAFLATLVIRAHKSRILTGREGLLGEVGVAQNSLNPEGSVFVRGELWTAISESGKIIKKGRKVIIKEIDKMKLLVSGK